MNVAKLSLFLEMIQVERREKSRPIQQEVLPGIERNGLRGRYRQRRGEGKLKKRGKNKGSTKGETRNIMQEYERNRHRDVRDQKQRKQQNERAKRKPRKTRHVKK